MDTDKAKSTAEKMLGQVLVTKQSGEGGKPVNTLYLASKLDLVNEMYFAILLDRATAGPMLIGCSEGGLLQQSSARPSCPAGHCLEAESLQELDSLAKLLITCLSTSKQAQPLLLNVKSSTFSLFISNHCWPSQPNTLCWRRFDSMASLHEYKEKGSRHIICNKWLYSLTKEIKPCRPAGGTSIEDLAEKYPEKIIKIPVDIFEGITDEQANQMVEGLAVKGDKKAAAEQIKSLYKCFTDSDCTMVEVSFSPFCPPPRE